MAEIAETVSEDYERGFKDGLKSECLKELKPIMVELAKGCTEAIKGITPMLIDNAQLTIKHAVNRWIPVKDALPEIKEFHISDTVLCYCDSGVLAIARLEENGFGQVWFNCEKDDEYHHSAGKVLYWMQIPDIPEPPKEGASDD